MLWKCHRERESLLEKILTAKKGTRMYVVLCLLSSYPTRKWSGQGVRRTRPRVHWVPSTIQSPIQNPESLKESHPSTTEVESFRQIFSTTLRDLPWSSLERCKPRASAPFENCVVEKRTVGHRSRMGQRSRPSRGIHPHSPRVNQMVSRRSPKTLWESTSQRWS